MHNWGSYSKFSGTSTLLTLSDPMVVIYTKRMDGSLQEVGRTEVILNSISPKWIRKFNITYQFEMVQHLVFRVYDVDTQFHNVDVKMLKVEDQQFLGEAIGDMQLLTYCPILLNLQYYDRQAMISTGPVLYICQSARCLWSSRCIG